MELTASEIISTLAETSETFRNKPDSDSGIMYVGQITYALFNALKRKFKLWKGCKSADEHIRITPRNKYVVWYKDDVWGLEEVA